jgi:hypothetical protein
MLSRSPSSSCGWFEPPAKPFQLWKIFLEKQMEHVMVSIVMGISLENGWFIIVYNGKFIYKWMIMGENSPIRSLFHDFQVVT